MQKQLFAALAVAVTVAVPLSAQETARPKKAQPAVSQHDIDALREAVAALHAAAQPPADAASVREREAHAAAVAGAVMEMGAQALAPVTAQVARTSPDVWRAMVLRQYVKGAEHLAVPLGMFIFSLVVWSIARPLRQRVGDPVRKDEEFSGYINKALGVCAYVVPLAIVFDSLTRLLAHLAQVVGYLLNPEYYAFRDLLTMLLAR